MNELKKDLYTAFADVMFEYRDYPIAEADHKEELKTLMNEVIDKFFESGADE